jgi:hypothetical protein
VEGEAGMGAGGRVVTQGDWILYFMYLASVIFIAWIAICDLRYLKKRMDRMEAEWEERWRRRWEP